VTFAERIGGFVIAPRRVARAVLAGAGHFDDILPWIVIVALLQAQAAVMRAVAKFSVSTLTGASSVVRVILWPVLVDALAVWAMGALVYLALRLAGAAWTRTRVVVAVGYAYIPYAVLAVVAALADRVGLQFNFLPLDRFGDFTVEELARYGFFEGLALLGLRVAGHFAVPLVYVALVVSAARQSQPAPALPRSAPRPSAPARASLVPTTVAVALMGLTFSAIAIDVLRAWDQKERFAPPSAGQAAPDFTLGTVDGQALNLQSLKGQAVVLTFFATWCQPCGVELPMLQRIADDDAKAHGGKPRFAIVGVSRDDAGEESVVKAFTGSLGLRFPVGIDEGPIARAYRVDTLPTLVVIGADGIVRRTSIGLTPETIIKTWIEDAIEAR
jgi:cytochrome c biogenesis protein CcmG, thiol:disulfide interchange protein DsbE